MKQVYTKIVHLKIKRSDWGNWLDSSTVPLR